MNKSMKKIMCEIKSNDRIKIKYIFLVFFLFSIAIFSKAQNIENPVLYLPQAYNYPYESVTTEYKKDKIPSMLWIVYSDRDSNKTYEKPGGNRTKKTINFLDKFYVLEETENFLRIVKDPNMTYSGIPSKKAEDYGWISKDKLLLWTHCLVTNKGKIDKKGMVLNTLEAVKNNDIRKIRSQKVSFSNNPELDKENENSTRLYDVFFIYKQTEKAILLGTASIITDKSRPDLKIEGWMPRKRITTWDHRIAIEPNWDDNAAKEREFYNVKASILIAPDYIDELEKKEKPRPKAVCWDNDQGKKRNIGQWRRFPVLETNTLENYYEVGVMGEIRSDVGILTKIDHAEVKKKYEKMRNARRNINIVFVIDGSTSMQPYFNSVSEAINKSMKIIDDNYVQGQKYNQYKFGAAVYRDFAEKDRKIEIIPLNSNYIEISEKLGEVVAIDYNDKDKPEAVFFGIDQALRSVGLVEDETNIIILIGDAGNHHRDDETKISEQEVINKLSHYSCHFLAFQVNNDPEYNTYDEFVNQVKSIILRNAHTVHSSCKKLQVFGKTTKYPPNFVSIEPNKLAFNIDTLDNTAVMGKIVYPDKGKKIQAKILTNEILSFVNYADKYVNDLVLEIDKLLKGGGFNTDENKTKKTAYTGTKVSAFNEEIVHFLSTSGISDEDIGILCSEHFQMYFPGYTPIKINGMKYPPFQRVLFLEKLEFSEIVSDMKKVMEAGSGSSRRKRLEDIWIEVLKKHIGNVDEYELKEMTMEDINMKVYGLPGTSDILKDTKLGDFKNHSIVTDDEITRYINNISRKYEKLHSIFSKDSYEYSFRSNDNTYYWISENLIP